MKSGCVNGFKGMGGTEERGERTESLEVGWEFKEKC